MWEYDRNLILAYKNCMQGVVTEMREGGDVDLANACANEYKLLDKGLNGAIANYKRQHDIGIKEKK